MDIEAVSEKNSMDPIGTEENQPSKPTWHEKIPALPLAGGWTTLSGRIQCIGPLLNSVHQAESSAVRQALVMTEERLAQLLIHMLDAAIDGRTNQFVQEWMPSMTIESIATQKDQHLKEFPGSPEAAIEAAIQRSHGTARKVATTVAGCIPIIGAPTSYSITLWHQLREVALIAALYGHDLQAMDVKIKILGTLLEGNVMKVPAQSVDMIAKMIMKAVLLETAIPNIGIPTHLIFNYLTGNSAKVSTYAIATFKPV